MIDRLEEDRRKKRKKIIYNGSNWNSFNRKENLLIAIYSQVSFFVKSKNKLKTLPIFKFNTPI
jgi:hypothetical protein